MHARSLGCSCDIIAQAVSTALAQALPSAMQRPNSKARRAFVRSSCSPICKCQTPTTTAKRIDVCPRAHQTTPKADYEILSTALTSTPTTAVNTTADNAEAKDDALTPDICADTSMLHSPSRVDLSLPTLLTTYRIHKQQLPPDSNANLRPPDASGNSQGTNGPNPRSHSYNTRSKSSRSINAG